MSIELCDQVVMDFMAATEVWKFSPKWSGSQELAQSLGLKRGIGGNGVNPFFRSFILSFIYQQGWG
jgi:hypothetical protein